MNQLHQTRGVPFFHHVDERLRIQLLNRFDQRVVVLLSVDVQYEIVVDRDVVVCNAVIINAVIINAVIHVTDIVCHAVIVMNVVDRGRVLVTLLLMTRFLQSITTHATTKFTLQYV
jgi:hypothetical protein